MYDTLRAQKCGMLINRRKPRVRKFGPADSSNSERLQMGSTAAVARRQWYRSRGVWLIGAATLRVAFSEYRI